MDEMDNLGQNEIEGLLRGDQSDPPSAPRDSASGTDNPDPTRATASGPTPDSAVDADVQQLIKQAEEALASVDDPVESTVPGLQPFELKDFTASAVSSEKASLDLLSDVELSLRIELGRTYMHLQDVLELRKGSVVQLDRPAGDPVDVLVNGRLVARGEVLVLNDTFCIRVGELISSNETD